MSNEKRKFLGKALAYLYSSQSGKTHSSMTIDETSLAQIQDSLSKAGPGSRIRLKVTSDKYRNDKASQLRNEGKKGSPAQYIVEVLSAAELAEERAQMDSRNNSEDGSL
jgi:hypothetical protein